MSNEPELRSFGKALQKEIRKALKAGRHAFESGYRDAVSRDITNLHLGSGRPDLFSEALKDVRFALKEKTKITYDETVGLFLSSQDCLS